MTREWYYEDNGEAKGPVNEAELKEKLVAKAVPADVLVWTEEMTDWAAANSLPEFQLKAPPRPAASAPDAPAVPVPVPPVSEAPPVPPTPAAPAISEPGLAASQPDEKDKDRPAKGEVSKEDQPPVVPSVTTLAKKGAAPGASAAAPPVKPKPKPKDPSEEGEGEEFDVFEKIVRAPRAIEVNPEDHKKTWLLAAVGYFYIFFLLPLVLAPNSAFARYHGNQSLTLFFVGTIWWFINAMAAWFAGAATSIQLVGWFVNSLFLVPIIFSIIGMVNAYKGRAVPLPLIGRFTLLR